MGNGMCEIQQDSAKYACTHHEATCQSPYFLMFGCEPRLPLDLAFGVDLGERHGQHSSYTMALKNILTEVYKLARTSLKETRAKQKKDYDLKVRGATIEPVDRVLVKILAFEGKHKLADRWEDEPYVVLQQQKPNPVSVV